MHRDDFSTLMDQVIVRENLPGNSAAEPKKTVQIMISADFEDSSVPQEKVSAFYFLYFCHVRQAAAPISHVKSPAQ